MLDIKAQDDHITAYHALIDIYPDPCVCICAWIRRLSNNLRVIYSKVRQFLLSDRDSQPLALSHENLTIYLVCYSYKLKYSSSRTAAILSYDIKNAASGGDALTYQTCLLCR